MSDDLRCRNCGGRVHFRLRLVLAEDQVVEDLVHELSGLTTCPYLEHEDFPSSVAVADERQ